MIKNLSRSGRKRKIISKTKSGETNSIGRIFAIADLHLTFSGYPPEGMRKFGKNWDKHPEIIVEKWNEIVHENDTTILVGDTSWAKIANDAIDDALFLTLLNGKKILIEGNHDRWMKNLASARSIMPENITILRHGFMIIDRVGIIGFRGISFENPFTAIPQSTRRYQTELNRLLCAIETANAAYTNGVIDRVLIATHFPPFAKLETIDSGFVPYFNGLYRSIPTSCVFGHIHNKEEWDRVCQGTYTTNSGAFEHPAPTIEYHLVAADYLQFIPKLIIDNPDTM